jgi:hypothetical protein
MKPYEKYLYHQIHPLKLLTDWASGIICLYPLWNHHLVLGLLIMLIPPPIASFLLVRFADLEKYKRSAFGKYISEYMTRAVEAIRLLGFAVMAIGAWYNSVHIILLGLIIIILAWFNGKLFLKKV